MSQLNLKTRLRRNRRFEAVRDSLAETHLTVKNLVNPLFICSGKNQQIQIKAMPGISRLSLDLILKEIEHCLSLGVRSFALFPAIEDHLKNKTASEALNKKSFAITSIFEIKKRFPEAILFTDIDLDPFSSDGHDGLARDGLILNDETVKILSEMACLQAEAGADYVCPSDMMDGRVGALRRELDRIGYTDTGILSYSAKYASCFYGPFREALDSTPQFGDKKTYQMDFRNTREALREVKLDINEGADIVMVKPALAYLDIIQSVRQNFNIPIAAYNVSGEYAMIKFAGLAGAIDENKAMLESLIAIRRAGAELIFTYFAKQFAELKY
jgi:porphobilinogen synthase